MQQHGSGFTLVATVFLVLTTSVMVNALAAQSSRPDQKTSEKPGAHAGQPQDSSASREQPVKDNSGSGNSSRIQILYAPADIVPGGDCESQITPLSIRATAKNLQLHGPIIAGGGLADKDSPSSQISAQAFQILQKVPNGPICERYSEIDASQNLISDDFSQPHYLFLRDGWIKAGNYTGTLWLAAKEDSGAQAVTVKVLVRPWQSWFLGALLILAGALVSWLALVYAVRQRQLGANQVLIARLAALLGALEQILENMQAGGAPAATQTLDHLRQVQSSGLRSFLNDKELSVLAGVTVPPAETITITDEIEGLNRIVRQGFSRLLDLWNDPAADHNALQPLFRSMDNLGGAAQPLNTLDQKIQDIINRAPAPVAHLLAQPQMDLPQEDVVVHRIVGTTHVLDIISLLTVLVLGLYVLIWKNPGFGTPGNYVEAFLWGLGLKLGTDVTKLGPGDVRTAFGLKIPGT